MPLDAFVERLLAEAIPPRLPKVGAPASPPHVDVAPEGPTTGAASS